MRSPTPTPTYSRGGSGRSRFRRWSARRCCQTFPLWRRACRATRRRLSSGSPRPGKRRLLWSNGSTARSGEYWTCPISASAFLKWAAPRARAAPQRWSVSWKTKLRSGSASSKLERSSFSEQHKNLKPGGCLSPEGPLVPGLAPDAARCDRMDVQPLVADVVAAFHALVYVPVGEALARGFDLPQLTHVTVEQRVAEFLQHAGDRFVPGVIYGAGEIREPLARHLRDGLAYLLPDFLAQCIEPAFEFRALCGCQRHESSS